METSLHRELKRLYAGPTGRTEVRLGRFRVDAVVEDPRGTLLIEIQHGPLWAIRDKIRRLVEDHRVHVVKPIIRRRRLLKCDRRSGRVIAARFSPRQGRLLELFDELVFCTRMFPHPNLTLEVVLVDIEERRISRPVRRGRKRFVVADQELLAIHESVLLAAATDVKELAACTLPAPFHTAHLADALGVERFVGQRIAYVLRQTGAVETVGKQRGAWLYQWKAPDHRRRVA